MVFRDFLSGRRFGKVIPGFGVDAGSPPPLASHQIEPSGRGAPQFAWPWRIPSQWRATLFAMNLSALRSLFSFRKRPATPPVDFLTRVSGVVHVGANQGQERDQYAALGLAVLWVEPIPEVFSMLQENIAGFPNQRALQYLITDREDQPYTFNIANNLGRSSSILDFKLHKDIWPSVQFTHSVTLRSRTLAGVLAEEKIDPSLFQALVIDTQGSELLVMRGAGSYLGQFQFIKTEVADFEAYEGCCQLDEVTAFLAGHGFREYSRAQLAVRKKGGTYYDIVYWKPARRKR